MKTYAVTATVTISLYADVEARSKKEAIRIAGDLAMPSIYVPGRNDEGCWQHSGEIDGEATGVKIVEED